MPAALCVDHGVVSVRRASLPGKQHQFTSAVLSHLCLVLLYSYDYGVQYIEEDFGGECKCGADCCYSKLKKQKEAASSAPSPSAAAAAVAAAGDTKQKGNKGAGCSKQR